MRGHEIVDLFHGWRVLLGHQRLSILDLSDAGRQPMWSPDGKSVIAYNGEIYNYLEISQELGFRPRSGSDTEVLLELFQCRGVRSGLQRLNGMWAFVLVHPDSREVVLGRDRAGKKPLYVYRDGKRNTLFVASELKTVARLSGGTFKVNKQVAAEYLIQALQDSSEQSWLEGVETLPAGSFASVGFGEDGLSLRTERVWAPPVERFRGNIGEAIARTRDGVMDAIALRLRSDVPVGITLSGGIDSSIIAAVVRRLGGSGDSVTAISAVSPGQSGDESPHIDRVCDALGIRSHRVDLSWAPRDTFDLMRKVTWHNDAPLGSFSNIAFFRLMELSRALGVKVVLSGQGGDELFCGYRKYFFWTLAEQVKAGHAVRAAANLWGSWRMGTVLTQFNLAEASRYLPWKRRRAPIVSQRLVDAFVPVFVGQGARGVCERQIVDFTRLSVPYLTHYEDRGSMAHGVEVRLPYLDYRLVELAMGLPTEYKVRHGWTKYVLRRAFEDLLPKATVWRTDKQGFSNPQEAWLKGELRCDLDALFRSDARIYEFGLVDKLRLLELWQRFLGGDHMVWHRELFAPWALEVWLSAFGPFLAGS